MSENCNISESYDTIIPYRQQLIAKSNIASNTDFFRKSTGCVIKIPNSNDIYKNFFLCLNEFVTPTFSRYNTCIICDNPAVIRQGISLQNLDELKKFEKEGRYLSNIWFIAFDEEKGLMAVNYNKPFLSNYYRAGRNNKSIDLNKCIAFPFIANSYFIEVAKEENPTWCIVPNPGDVIYTPQEVPFEESEVTFTQAVQFCIEDAKTVNHEDFLSILNDYIIVADDIFPQYTINQEVLKSIKNVFLYPHICFGFDLQGRIQCFSLYLEDNNNDSNSKTLHCNRIDKPSNFFSIYYEYISWKVYNFKTVKDYWAKD